MDAQVDTVEISEDSFVQASSASSSLETSSRELHGWRQLEGRVGSRDFDMMVKTGEEGSWMQLVM